MTIKILNLYAGIGGNRKLWGGDIMVTAVEIEPSIAKIYQDFFPQDKVIVADAHQYLLEHYKEFDFIWSSPPCPTHSDIRRCVYQSETIPSLKPVYPDMKLYEEIIFLMNFSKCPFVVENVIGYYKPLIRPFKVQRHYFWSNFVINNNNNCVSIKRINNSTKNHYNFNLDKYDDKSLDKRKLLRNLVNPILGLSIFNDAFKEKQMTLQ